MVPVKVVEGHRFLTQIGKGLLYADYEPAAYKQGLIWNCTNALCPNTGNCRNNLPEGIIPKCDTCNTEMSQAINQYQHVL